MGQKMSNFLHFSATRKYFYETSEYICLRHVHFVLRQRYEDILRDGVILCNLINKISPGSVKKIQERGTNFQLMENIQRWVEIQKLFFLKI